MNKLRKNRDKRVTRLITFMGETKPLGVWAEQMGISVNTLHHRISNGWTIERALSQKVQ